MKVKSSRDVPKLSLIRFIPPDVPTFNQALDPRFDLLWLRFKSVNHMHDFLQELLISDSSVLISLHYFDDGAV